MVSLGVPPERCLDSAQTTILDEMTANHGGAVLFQNGERRIYEFTSVIDAAECAVELQRSVRVEDDLNALSEYLRLGIDLGDVVKDQEGIHGDGIVGVAALEAIADPGGICISSIAYDQVKGRLDAGFEDLGSHSVDDRRSPLHAYRITPASFASTAPKDLPLPEKPSIAVLPFENLSGDHDQQYFSDGITMDLTTALSRFDWLFVAARNSAFSYKGGAVDIGQVRRELGVRYLIEGSVRRASDRVRVNVEIIDTETSGQIWAEKYDRQMDDIFALQDDIVANIASTVGPEITLAEISRTQNKRPETLDAWDIYLRASALYHRMNATDLEKALEHLEQVMSLEPNFANAYALAGLCYAQRAVRGWVRPVGASLETARELAEKAVYLSPASSEANHALGFILSITGKAEEALVVARRAIDRNPNFSDAYSVLGHSLIFLGHLDEGLEACKVAIRSNPRDQRGTWVYDAIGHAHFFKGEYERAIEVSRKGLNMDPSLYGAWVTLACANAQLGRTKEARAAIDGLLNLIPRYTLSALEKNPMFIAPELVSKLIDSMRLAGLPK